MKYSLKIIGFLFISLFVGVVAYANKQIMSTNDQSQVIALVKKAELYATKNGIEKTIIKFKYAQDIFIGDYDGMFFVSPLHPELIGKNQFNYKDPTGKLVVQEEINRAKAGGGWLKGRWRYNALTKTYQCRKVYILPVAGNYFIGSWYHYSSDRKGICPT